MTHTLTINNWHPARLNEFIFDRHAAQRLKKAVTAVIALEAFTQQIPKATGKRRVKLTIQREPKQRAGDVDAYWKSTLDALTACGLLIDDNHQNCEIAPVQYTRGDRKATVIELEEMGAA